MPDSLLYSSETKASASGLIIGSFVGIDGGRLLVDYPGNSRGPVAARSTLTHFPDPAPPVASGVRVLLAFAEIDPATPILIGFLTETWPVHANEAPLRRRLSLTAAEEIEIGCGESSIVLKADGTLIIKAKRISSRARESNKIKGATVNIN